MQCACKRHQTRHEFQLFYLFLHPPEQDVDPNQEAFQIMDPHGTGYVEMNVLRRLLLQLPGVDQVNDDVTLPHSCSQPDYVHLFVASLHAAKFVIAFFYRK